MAEATLQAKPTQAAAPAKGREQHRPLAHLQQAIEHGAHLLPSQGPITVFVHHNTLHAY